MNDTFKTMKGEIELFSVKDGKWNSISKQHNLITYQGSDILAKALSGDMNINSIYIVFENNPGAVRLSEDIGNTQHTYANSSADRSFIRVSTMGEPVFTSEGTDYINNQVSFLGVTDGNSFFPAVPIIDGTSVFYHAALVSSPYRDDQAGDAVFSCADLTSDITKVAGAQIGIRWTITFTSPTP